MEENKVKSAEFLAETEKLKAELKAKMEAQRAQEIENARKAREARQAQQVQKAQENHEAQETKEAKVEKQEAKAEQQEAKAEQPEAKTEKQEVQAEQPEAQEEQREGDVEQHEAEMDYEEIVLEDAKAENGKKKNLKKRIFNIIYDVLIVVGVALLLYGGYTLYQDYAESEESKQSYENLKDQYVTVPSGGGGNTAQGGNSETEPPRPKEWYEQIWVDLVGLQTEVNEDIIGWIYFENEDISYPILYSADNNEYDRVRYDLVYAMCGSITLEATNQWDFSDPRNIIYGHNMRDLSMFGKLKYYKEEGYYQDHQYFQLMYDGMVYRYQIFSYFEVDETEVSYVRVNYNENNTYEAMIEKLVSNAMHETGVEVTAEDKTVTLLTCADDKTKRLLVNAVLVDQHVMANADGTYPDEEPDTDNPGTEEPGTEPGTENPGTEDPDIDNPGTEEPGTEPDDRFEQEYTYTYVNKTMWATTGVKIRNQPSADSVRMGYLAKGQAVQVIAKCNENEWYRVQLRKGVGYVNGKYLTDVDPHVHTEIPGGTVEAHSKCESCGAIISAEHVYVDEVITPATTTAVGQMKHTCACGYTYNSEIPMITDTPSTEEPGTDEPGTDEPGTEESGTEEPGADEPGTEEPGTDEPGTEEPGTDEPGTEEPGTDEPGTEEPGTDEPGTDEPSTDEPGTEPTPDPEPSEEPSEPADSGGTDSQEPTE